MALFLLLAPQHRYGFMAVIMSWVARGLSLRVSPQHHYGDFRAAAEEMLKPAVSAGTTCGTLAPFGLSVDEVPVTAGTTCGTTAALSAPRYP
ncbi:MULTISPECIES: hypothetical protein [unclassified Streptomyces]|uniref:hypothetical protein n=1 Tax=unclassified Streptomyces TaxID=2593676 RepID=UPI001BE95B97|nr:MULTISPECIES: hypothetical protein [unclassified Streptomyces]MBT2404610.1 hypothetical protein [Streptomyces sp. ISL-21]MBT2610493.1 hypothetical protein [Streptomyces sp. ISL-87]